MCKKMILKIAIGLMLVLFLVGCQPPMEYLYTFDTFPDGTPITGDTTDAEGYVWQSLQGDEFSEWGFLVASTPISNCVAVRMNFCWTTTNFLALLGGGSCLNVRRIEITFIEPVLEVELSFSGASTNYVMDVYDTDGNLLGSPYEMAEFNKEGRLFTITYRSDSVNISRISFGAYLETDVVVVAIREIKFAR